MARVVFMGTPAFAVPSLVALCDAHQVLGVVTQPDRPAGRGRKVVISPVKEAALERGLDVFQPESLRPPEAIQHLAQWQPDVIVVAAFGQILRAQLLNLPPHGSLNVHASLLPLYRGAAPIPAAILAGDLGTGVTIMRMDEGLDTGPILARAELAILPNDTTETLTATLAVLGAQLLLETLPGWLAGRVPEQPQDASLASYCRPLEKADGWLDWSQPAVRLDRQVRACDPWPGTYTTWQGQRLKVLRTRPLPGWAGEAKPGHLVALEDGFGVVTGQGLLVVLEVQLAGKKPMAAGPFVQGQRHFIDSTLGT
jgi:methionyl-tRNA formyltransferase